MTEEMCGVCGSEHGEEFVCTPVQLPDELQLAAAQTAITENPANRPDVERIAEIMPIVMTAMGLEGAPPPEVVVVPGYLAALTSKYWGSGGVKLSVGFMEQIGVELRDRILSHMNSWGEWGNVQFFWTQSLGSAQVRVSRSGEGYWSYLGTDILHISRNQPTMNLQGFTDQTSEATFRRVVRHETGHTLGCPHEHLRRAIIDRLDVQKTIAWGASYLRWSEQMVRSQILTPLEESSIMGTPEADTMSVMCYPLPASITKDGLAIPGGLDIDQIDKSFIGKLYPLATPPPPPPPPASDTTIRIRVEGLQPITLNLPFSPDKVKVEKT